MAGPIVLDQGPRAITRVNYVLDPFGNQLELVEYMTQAFQRRPRSRFTGRDAGRRR